MTGHLEIIGETIAKFELYQNGWNPFEHFVDDDKVDLVIRKRSADGDILFREIQVKHGRFYESGKSGWRRTLFARTAWRNFARQEFCEDRKNFFVMLVFGGTMDFQYAGDTFVFRGSDFHGLLQQLPAFRRGGEEVAMYLALGNDGRWYVLKDRKKIACISQDTCIDVTNARRNFGILSENPT
jgi:hypothetical protein